MPTHTEAREMPYSAQQLYDLVADIGSYPEFLPWCAAVRVRQERPLENGVEVDAEMVVSFKLFREKFGSRVRLFPEDKKIDVAYLDGPFRYLDNAWSFVELGPDRCRVDFHVDFEFKSRALQAIIGVVFDEAMRRIVRAFEARAEALYGRAA